MTYQTQLEAGRRLLTEAGDDPQQLGMALLRLHSALEELLREWLSQAPELDRAVCAAVMRGHDVKWPQLLDLLIDLGELPDADARSLRCWNRLRNEFAHRGSCACSRADVVAYESLVLQLFAEYGPERGGAAEEIWAERRDADRVGGTSAPPRRGVGLARGGGWVVRGVGRALAAIVGALRRGLLGALSSSLVWTLIALVLGCATIASTVTGCSSALSRNSYSRPQQPTGAPELSATTMVSPTAAAVLSRAAADAATAPDRQGLAVIGRATGRVNLRAAPGLEATIVAKLAPGTEVRLTGERAAADGRSWLAIRVGDLTGWVSAELVRAP